MSSAEEIGTEDYLQKQTTLCKDLAEQITAEINKAEINKNPVSQQTVQKLLTLGVKLYFEKLEDGEYFPPFLTGEHVTASEVLTAVSEMMQQVNVEIFELGLWQSCSKS